MRSEVAAVSRPVSRAEAGVGDGPRRPATVRPPPPGPRRPSRAPRTASSRRDVEPGRGASAPGVVPASIDERGEVEPGARCGSAGGPTGRWPGWGRRLPARPGSHAEPAPAPGAGPTPGACPRRATSAIRPRLPARDLSLARPALTRRARTAAMNGVRGAQQDDRVSAQLSRQAPSSGHRPPSRPSRPAEPATPLPCSESRGQQWIAAQ